MDELSAAFMESKSAQEYIDRLRSLGPDPLDIKGMIRHAFGAMFLSDQMVNEIQVLPMHLQETLAFFTYFMRCGAIHSRCGRPEGAQIPYLTCSCKDCLDAYHQRWAEAEEKHWDLMNRFLASLNYFYDSRYHYNLRCGPVNMNTVPIIPCFVRVYGVKQNLVLVNNLKSKEKIKETKERILIILVRHTDGCNIPNKVIMSGPRSTYPYPSSYIFISGRDYVNAPMFCFPHDRLHGATGLQSTGWAVWWMIKNVLIPLLFMRFFSRLFL